MSQPSPFRLVTLGRLALVGPGGAEEESLRKRRRKLAVLAVLAMEQRAVPRDLLVEMFWGDQEEDRARHSLSDALSHLRRVIGRGAIALSRSEVALVPDAAPPVDALDFLAAVQRQEHERVVAGYAGAFLDGVYASPSLSYDHWVERQRRRLESAYLRSCGELCAALARARRWEECAAVSERWLELAPLSADAALYRLNALKAPATREADRRALDEYERLRSRLRGEFDLEPDPALARLAANIGERLTPAAPVSRALPDRGIGPPVAPPDAAPPGGTPLREEGMRPPADPGVAPTSPRPVLVRRARWGAAAALALALVLYASAAGRETAPASPNAVAVLPFAVRGDGELAYLREGMAHLLSTNLDGAGALRSVDPRAVLGFVDRERLGELDPDDGRLVARRYGAGLFILGDVVAAGEQVRISAALYDRGRREAMLARGAVEGPAASLFALVDQLTRQLLAGYPERSPDRLTGLAAATTTSLPALKAYLAGTSHYRAARYDAALAAFQRAARLDSTFALAHYQRSQSALWAGAPWDSVLSASRSASRHAGRLTRRARLLVEAHQAFRTGELDRAERLYRVIVADHPDDVEGWYHLGDLLFHGNAVRGRPLVESRAPFEQVLALEPDHRAAIVHLVRVAARDGDRTAVDTLSRRALAFTQPGGHAELHALRAAVTRTPSAWDSAAAALRTAPDEIVRISAERVALFAGDLDGAARLERLLVEPTRGADFRAVGYLSLADLAVARGHLDAARPLLDSAARIAPVIAAERRALFLAAPFLPARRGDLAAARDELARWDGTAPPTVFPMFGVYNGLHPHIRRYLLGLLDVRLGDLAAATAQVRSLESSGGAGATRAFAATLAESLRGHALAARGEFEEALAAFERGRLVAPEGLLDAAIGNQALERYARAELLRELGRDEEAARWYASLGETTLDQVIYLAPAALRLGEIEERRGNPRAAAAHYLRFLTLWEECDPELRPLVAETARRAGMSGYGGSSESHSSVEPR